MSPPPPPTFTSRHRTPAGRHTDPLGIDKQRIRAPRHKAISLQQQSGATIDAPSAAAGGADDPARTLLRRTRPGPYYAGPGPDLALEIAALSGW